MSFSRDGRRLFVGHGDGQLWVWDTATWEQVLALPIAAWAPVQQIAVNPGGRWLVTLADNVVKLWEGGPEP
jgi:hypothetical protein